MRHWRWHRRVRCARAGHPRRMWVPGERCAPGTVAHAPRRAGLQRRVRRLCSANHSCIDATSNARAERVEDRFSARVCSACARGGASRPERRSRGPVLVTLNGQRPLAPEQHAMNRRNRSKSSKRMQSTRRGGRSAHAFVKFFAAVGAVQHRPASARRESSAGIAMKVGSRRGQGLIKPCPQSFVALEAQCTLRARWGRGLDEGASRALRPRIAHSCSVIRARLRSSRCLERRTFQRLNV
jgi:hypothetical protein